MSNILESFTGRTVEGKKSRLPARLDYWQSATGLFLGLFMVAHMFLVSSILLGKDAMYAVAKLLEASFIFEGGQPFLVSLAAMSVFTIFIVHAGLAVRKFPISYKQLLKYKTHMELMNHPDTTKWFTQVVTGFIMFFLGSVHLYVMISQPDTIGPHGSSDRFVSDWMWPLYLVLLVAVELHASIGLYRLAVKWGWFDGPNPKETRKNLQKIKGAMSVFFIVLGLLTFAAYMKIGFEQKSNNNVGNKYKPTAELIINISDEKARV